MSELDPLLAKLRALSLAGPKLAAIAAQELDRQLRANIDQGVAPDGTPWQFTQDGRQPLVNAGAALTVQPIGSVVVATLTGPEARHHLGTARGKIKRQILPDKLSPSLASTLERVLPQALAEIARNG